MSRCCFTTRSPGFDSKSSILYWVLHVLWVSEWVSFECSEFHPEVQRLEIKSCLIATWLPRIPSHCIVVPGSQDAEIVRIIIITNYWFVCFFACLKWFLLNTLFVFYFRGHFSWLQLDRRVLEHEFPKKSGPIVLHFCVRWAHSRTRTRVWILSLWNSVSGRFVCAENPMTARLCRCVPPGFECWVCVIEN